MRHLVVFLLCGLASVAGCATYRAPCAPKLANPLLVPAGPCELVWDQIVDVIDDDFDISNEQRIRPAGDVLTVGRIDTEPRVGATLLEPWRGDAADRYERLHGTLQTVRRRVVAQVVPAGDVYQIEVTVFKELENVGTADYSTAASATFRNESTLRRIEEPVGMQPIAMGWIPLGRDTAMEQRILGKLADRLGTVPGMPAAVLPGMTETDDYSVPQIMPGEAVPTPTPGGAPSIPPGETLPPGVRAP